MAFAPRSGSKIPSLSGRLQGPWARSSPTPAPRWPGPLITRMPLQAPSRPPRRARSRPAARPPLAQLAASSRRRGERYQCWPWACRAVRQRPISGRPGQDAPSCHLLPGRSRRGFAASSQALEAAAPSTPAPVASQSEGKEAAGTPEQPPPADRSPPAPVSRSEVCSNLCKPPFLSASPSLRFPVCG